MAITPDTKDWTWVLGEPCPDCGLDVSGIDPAAVAGRFRASVPLWQAVLRRTDVARRPDESTWSDLEYVCHVRDVFTLFAQRFRRVLTEDDPVFDDWDQDEAAVEHDYAGQSPVLVARELAMAADGVARVLDGAGDDDWGRPGRRSNGSRFTLATLAQYALHDVEHHAVDVGR